MKITKDFLDFIKKETNKLYKAKSIVNVICADSPEGMFGVITYASTQTFSTTKQKLFKFDFGDRHLYFQNGFEPSIDNLECSKKSKGKFEGVVME